MSVELYLGVEKEIHGDVPWRYAQAGPKEYRGSKGGANTI